MDDAPLWSGPVRPVGEDIVTRAGGGLSAEGVDDLRHLPLVEIGRPIVWRITETGLGDVRLRSIDDADFYIVRCSCSLVPRRETTAFEWARFLVSLLPDESGAHPVAYDMHPREVTQPVRKQMKLSVGPDLKFGGATVSAGSFEYDLSYEALEPVVTATGLQTSEPKWDFERTKSIPLQGSKIMHLMIRAPKGMPQGRTRIDFTADVRTRALPSLPVGLFSQRGHEDSEPLTTTLWER